MTADTPLSPDTTLATLVAERPPRAQLLEGLRLDYCCGGGQTLAEACAKRGLDLDAVQAALRRLEDPGSDDDVENTDWRDVGVVALCDHIVSVHHDGLREAFPRIAGLLSTVVRVHGDREPRLSEVRRVFEEIRAELEPHLASEEHELFPACIAWEQHGTPVDTQTIDEHVREHAGVGDALEVLRDLCHDYDRQVALCNTHRALLDALETFEQDLHRHVHEENNILLARVRGPAPPRRGARVPPPAHPGAKRAVRRADALLRGVDRRADPSLDGTPPLNGPPASLPRAQESASHASQRPCDQQRPMASARRPERSNTARPTML